MKKYISMKIIVGMTVESDRHSSKLKKGSRENLSMIWIGNKNSEKLKKKI